ncbi:leucine-rich repeat domain-containing protein [Leptolyngbya cf. ectocarpi LEGE 11479]|uniref:Leucine-rich repeat domain-containing protein n=1 Tax=Leptolyngbya cf. ectocarpi LEGE 11479 TaxID=1828722 RepID=A0A928X2U5_LEPEC|nr:leucine-rich repeat domain-containing protein [Leptolyngbya ectocarpi]MBE9066033.1 leucine-rich repeat domain-containing protein [Leptolyngbya cf. ectocarpi LEGE 11479]
MAIAQVLKISPEEIVYETYALVLDDGQFEAQWRIQSIIKNKATELNLSGLGLTTLPRELRYFVNLTRLDLSSNQLTSVPKELCQLTNLTRLDLSQNQLISVPKELGQLTNLTWRLDEIANLWLKNL